MGVFSEADEEVPAPLANKLASIATIDLSQDDAYELTPRYMYLGRWLKRTQGYPSWHPRLVRHGTARFAGGVW